MNKYRLKSAKFKKNKQIDKSGAHGFVEYTLVDDATNEVIKRKRFNNFISSTAKMATLINYIGKSLMSDAVMYERYAILTGVGKLGSGTNQLPNIGTLDKICNCLWNLDSTQRAALSADNANIIPHSSPSSYLTDNLIGYAGVDVIPVLNGKSGAFDWCPSGVLKTKNSIVKQWMYDTTAANGTINCIGMAQNKYWENSKQAGTAIYECFDKTDLFNSNYIESTTRICPPGITGFTGSDEILLNYNCSGLSKHKRTLSTCETVDLADTDPWFVLPKYTCDCLVVGNYLYVFYIESTTPNLNVYDLSNSANLLASIYLGNSSTLGISDAMHISLFYDGTNLWVTMSKKASGICLIKINSNGTYFNNVGTTYSDYTQLGITLPSWVTNAYEVGFGNYGSNYVMYSCSQFNNAGTAIVNNRTSNAFIFTDKSNIGTTIIKVVNGVWIYSVVCIGTTLKGWLTTTGFSSNYSYNYGLDTSTTVLNLYKESTAALVELEFYNKGCWFLDETLGCGLFNIVDISADPIVKTDTQRLYIAYGDYIE